MTKQTLNAIDLFSGCGGLSEGLKQAGFKIVAGVEVNKNATKAYRMNHSDTVLFEDDIRKLDAGIILNLLKGRPLHLLAGCPPCQGFSSIRKLNRRKNIRDDRNSLILEYLRFVKDLQPLTIMMENVPGLKSYYLFKEMIKELKTLNYNPKFEIVDVSQYGVPQRRKRLVLVGSRLGPIEIAKPINIKKTVKKAIGHLPIVTLTNDPLHKIYPRHSSRILDRIKSIPKNGGSLKDAGQEHQYKCHENSEIGFTDVFGRMKWDDVAPTITGGCLNPSKGRFLHPEEDRGITAREAALLQTFPEDYTIPIDIPKDKISLLIGNALPPQFSYIQSKNIKEHLDKHFG